MNKEPVSYKQTDIRWAKLPYRVPGESATIGGSGCGPTCAAMLIQTLTGETYTPVDACNWSMEHGYKALNQGTYYSYFVPQFKEFGIVCERLNNVNVYGKPSEPVHDKVLELLKEGYYIIACMGKGTWTSSGHFVVVWWADNAIYINDPASSKTERLRGDPNTFRKQVKYYWSIDAREHNKEEPELTEEQIRKIVQEELYKNDALSPADWAKDNWEKGKKAGLTDGSRPQAFITRQETITMLLKSME